MSLFSTTLTVLCLVSINKSIGDCCPQMVKCPIDTRYRSPDGSCNNLRHPDLGKSFSPYARLHPPEYEDGLGAPRITGRSGDPLPSPRLVSVTISPHDSTVDSKSLTLMAMQWGQFLAHDIIHTAVSRGDDGQDIQGCCGKDGQRLHPNERHTSCFPIDIPTDDPFYSKEGNKTCMSFIRSAPVEKRCPQLCGNLAREQMNQLTSFIDGGMIYGKSQEGMNDLRTFKYGRLRVSSVDGGLYLPKLSKSGQCQIPHDQHEKKCFVAGDVRVNAHVDLVVMHTLFVRYHNWIASKLSTINPGWDDETVFQESRRIVIAQLQIITYKEYLPVVLGHSAMKTSQLNLQDGENYSKSYDESINPEILSSFATAAFRMHTLIPSQLNMVDRITDKLIGQVDLSDTFDNPSIIYHNRTYTSLLNGLTHQAASNYDQLFSHQVTRHLFRQPGQTSGVDLVAMNIQRGRDHGLPSYNRMRVTCGLDRLTSWSEVASIMRRGVGRTLQSVYTSVDDIDLFIGGVSELPVQPGSFVGPTFHCIIKEQFRRIKNGDRFWFENGPHVSPLPFTPRQLSELRDKTSLAKIICLEGRRIKRVQPFAMVKENHDSNRRVSCSTLPTIDLSLWKA